MSMTLTFLLAAGALLLTLFLLSRRARGRGNLAKPRAAMEFVAVWPAQEETDYGGEKRVNELFLKGDKFYEHHQFAQAADCYSEALDASLQALKADHPFTASAYNRLGMARMGDGYFGHARELFERAELIMSEWPERDQQLHDSIARNLSTCAGERGF